MFEDSGLVLEGGGMRGVFTAGALDCLLDNNVFFPYVIGVSAGASTGFSYMSRQRGRAKFCDIDALVEHPYIGLKFLFTQRCVMDYKYLFDDLPRKVCPFDFSAFRKASETSKFKMVATNCITGKPEYFDKFDDIDDALLKCKASCSLPYGCPICEVDGVPYLDGGISDAIPLKRAFADGCKKCFVILTRNANYRKKSYYNFLAPLLYRKYPNLVDALKTAHVSYNAMLDSLDSPEAQGKCVVVRPRRPLQVDRLEQNPAKLLALYNEGYDCCANALANANRAERKNI